MRRPGSGCLGTSPLAQNGRGLRLLRTGSTEFPSGLFCLGKQFFHWIFGDTDCFRRPACRFERNVPPKQCGQGSYIGWLRDGLGWRLAESSRSPAVLRTYMFRRTPVHTGSDRRQPPLEYRPPARRPQERLLPPIDSGGSPWRGIPWCRPAPCSPTPPVRWRAQQSPEFAPRCVALCARLAPPCERCRVCGLR